MSIIHRRQQQVKIWVESTFAVRPTDLDDFTGATTGSVVSVYGAPEYDLVQSMHENMNTVGTPDGGGLARHPKIKGVKSASTAKIVLPFVGSSPVAATGSQGTQDMMGYLLKGAMGGSSLSYSYLVDDTSTSTSVVLEDTTGISPHQLVFFQDADGDGSTNCFAVVTDVATGTISVFPPLTFTPESGDIMGAGAVYFLNEPSIADHTHTDHLTFGMALRDGNKADAERLLLGMKPSVAITGLEADQSPTLEISFKVTDFEDRPDQISAIDWDVALGDVERHIPLVCGAGSNTTHRFGNTGAAPTAVPYSMFAVENIGPEWASVDSPVGIESRSHFNGQMAVPTTVNTSLLFSSSYTEDFINDVEKYSFWQCGTEPGKAVCIITPRLAFGARMKMEDVNQRGVSQLQFDALSDTNADTDGLDIDSAAYQALRSPVMLGRSV